MEKKAFKPVRNTQRVEHKKVLEKNKNLSNASKTQPLVSVLGLAMRAAILFVQLIVMMLFRLTLSIKW